MTEPDFAPLRALFEPRSIAIVGASDDTQRMGGGLVLKFVRQHGFSGSIFPVNPKYAEIAELDLNPVVVLSEGNGCVALDYKFTLEPGEGA